MEIKYRWAGKSQKQDENPRACQGHWQYFVHLEGSARKRQ
jgi:hypothetical protein